MPALLRSIQSQTYYAVMSNRDFPPSPVANNTSTTRTWRDASTDFLQQFNLRPLLAHYTVYPHLISVRFLCAGSIYSKRPTTSPLTTLPCRINGAAVPLERFEAGVLAASEHRHVERYIGGERSSRCGLE